MNVAASPFLADFGPFLGDKNGSRGGIGTDPMLKYSRETVALRDVTAAFQNESRFKSGLALNGDTKDLNCKEIERLGRPHTRIQHTSDLFSRARANRGENPNPKP